MQLVSIEDTLCSNQYSFKQAYLGRDMDLASGDAVSIAES